MKRLSAGGKRKTKTIPLTLTIRKTTSIAVTVPAYTVGFFAVHRDIVDSDDEGNVKLAEGWTVTHVKTGLKAANGVRLLASARRIARALQSDTGIDWSAADVAGQCADPALGKKCLEVIQRYR